MRRLGDLMGKQRDLALLGPMALMLCGCLAAAAAGLSGLGVLPGFGAEAAPAAETVVVQLLGPGGR